MSERADNAQVTEAPQWYVVHTYSGYENKVMDDLGKTVENNGLQHLIYEIKVPIEEVAEIKGGKRRMVQHKTYPGYVLVKMIMTDEAWYVVRNTRGVTGFVGPGSKPVPLTEAEVEKMGVIGQPIRIDLVVGDTCRLLEGPFTDCTGEVESIDTVSQKVRVKIAMFGKTASFDLDLSQVERV